MTKKLLQKRLMAFIIALAVSQTALAVISTTQYQYDVANGTVTRTEPTDNRIKYHYDAVNRLSKIELLDSPNLATYDFHYDLTSQLERITSPEGETIFGYDDYDRLDKITDFGMSSPLLRFKYDHKDRLTEIAYPGNGRVCYQYDGDGRLTRTGRLYADNSALHCLSADEITDYRYDAQGQLSHVSYPNGINRQVKYHNITGQLQEVSYHQNTGSLIFSDTYEYVPASRLYANITRTTSVSRETTYYTYDKNERVKTVTEANGRRTEYTYDAFGNRLSEKIINTKKAPDIEQDLKPAGTYTHEYFANSNRLHKAYYNEALIETFYYDMAGRITKRKHTTDGETTYTYDDRGFLVGLNKPGYEISYTYDALGVRKSKTVNGVVTYYVSARIFGFSRTLVEFDEEKNITSTYVHGGGQILKEEPSEANRSLDLYYLTDGTLGNVRYTVDMDGRIQSKLTYETFGQRHAQQIGSGKSNGHYGYTGEMTETESGLIYLRARYYDPSIGRFIGVDPYLGRLSQPVTQNRYIYVHNNPLIFSDPSGNAAAMMNFCISGGAGAGTTGCTKVGIVANIDDFDWGADNFGIDYDFFLLNEAGGGGISGPSGSATATFEFNTATSVDQLKGISSQTGFTVNPFPLVRPATVEGGIVVGQDYTGFYFGGGVGAGSPFITYSYITNTFDPLPDKLDVDGICP